MIIKFFLSLPSVIVAVEAAGGAFSVEVEFEDMIY
jgi:hypothetical protein